MRSTMRSPTQKAELTMPSIQEKITANIQKTFEQYSFQPVAVKNCSNMGYWSIQRPDDLYEYGRVSFDFQGSYNTFKITIGDRKIESQPGRNGYYDFMIKTSDNDGYRYFMSVLADELHELKYLVDETEELV